MLSYIGFSDRDIDKIVDSFNRVDPGYYKVVKVNDGDTISVEMSGKTERVRLIGVDTPETQHPSKPVQCFGRRATEFTTNLIGASAVRLVMDPTNSNRDRYNRLLRYVYLEDETLVNAEIIKQGYGFAYTSFEFEKSSEFVEYENRARQESRGLWSECDVEEDDQFKSTNDDIGLFLP